MVLTVSVQLVNTSAPLTIRALVVLAQVRLSREILAHVFLHYIKLLLDVAPALKILSSIHQPDNVCAILVILSSMVNASLQPVLQDLSGIAQQTHADALSRTTTLCIMPVSLVPQIQLGMALLALAILGILRWETFVPASPLLA